MCFGRLSRPCDVVNRVPLPPWNFVCISNKLSVARMSRQRWGGDGVGPECGEPCTTRALQGGRLRIRRD